MESAFEKFKMAVSGNTAELYGNNVATFPCAIEMEFIDGVNSNLFRVRKQQNLTANESA